MSTPIPFSLSQRGRASVDYMVHIGRGSAAVRARAAEAAAAPCMEENRIGGRPRAWTSLRSHERRALSTCGTVAQGANDGSCVILGRKAP
jgi:hypothetical protein